MLSGSSCNGLGCSVFGVCLQYMLILEIILAMLQKAPIVCEKLPPVATCRCPGPGLAWLIWFNLTKCSRHGAAPQQQPSIILGTVQICQAAAGGGRGTWTVATEGVNKAALSTEIGMLVWAVLSKILKIACQYIFVDKCSNRWRDFV